MESRDVLDFPNSILLAVSGLSSNVENMRDIHDKKMTIIDCQNAPDIFAIIKTNYNNITAVILPADLPLEQLENISRFLNSQEDDQLLPLIIIGSVTPEQLKILRNGGIFHSLSMEEAEKNLVFLLGSAIQEFQRVRSLLEKIDENNPVATFIQSGLFDIKTLEEANNITTFLSVACPNSKAIAIGLSELLINAIEHGNLSIDFQEKSNLLETGSWKAEIETRLQQDIYKDKFVEINFTRDIDKIMIKITDQGNGFDWKPYLDFSSDRLFLKHGRGIALAKETVFDSISYNERGNEVTATILLD